MMGKKYIIEYILIIMFSFFGNAEAKYNKLFFDLNIKSIDGKEINFSEYKNKTILIVNVASKCGFTKQYADLQTLYENYMDKGLVIIGIPSNQFGGQEPGTNSEIKNFCETNFNITFPITDKVNVKGDNAHDVYVWAKENFGNSAVPKWNFHKILINKEGKIEETYGSFVKPMSKKIVLKLEELLN
jgi:glutathione peroxidase|tara:strand:- start:83 stop:640 length:558 start_codon:yes stop_codon:yes gene_type:complete